MTSPAFLSLPPALLAEILPFLEAGKTGRILLGVNRGRIESCEVTVHVRATATQLQSPKEV